MTEKNIGLMRMQFWKDEIENIFSVSLLSAVYHLTLMLLLSNLVNTNNEKKKKDGKSLKLWHMADMGTHLKALSECYPMSTNMTGFR